MSSPATILFCDHRGEGLVERAGRLSEAGHAVETTSSLRQTLVSLAAHAPALVVVDPLSSGGVELDAILEARGEQRGVPVLVVAEAHEPLPTVVGSRALERGLLDVIRRDAPVEEFELRIQMLLEDARKNAEMDELRHRATHDDRTNLLRPLEFNTQLRGHASAADRHGLDLALLLIDLDRFGQINKEFDHTVGDRIIERVGAVIRGALRVEDVAGRLGGDEFGVLLPYTRKVDAASVVQRLLSEIRALSGPAQGAGREVAVSASIGFETFSGRDLDSVETLRAHAEAALRHAKHQGGDRGVYFRNLEDAATGTA